MPPEENQMHQVLQAIADLKKHSDKRYDEIQKVLIGDLENPGGMSGKMERMIIENQAMKQKVGDMEVVVEREVGAKQSASSAHKRIDAGEKRLLGWLVGGISSLLLGMGSIVFWIIKGGGK